MPHYRHSTPYANNGRSAKDTAFYEGTCREQRPGKHSPHGRPEVVPALEVACRQGVRHVRQSRPRWLGGLLAVSGAGQCVGGCVGGVPNATCSTESAEHRRGSRLGASAPALQRCKTSDAHFFVTSTARAAWWTRQCVSVCAGARDSIDARSLPLSLSLSLSRRSGGCSLATNEPIYIILTLSYLML